MPTQKSDLTVRSLSDISHLRLKALKSYSRLTYGSLLDDAVEALWAEYVNEGHPLPEI